MTLRRGRPADRRLIKRIGRPVTWEKGLPCPNLRDDLTHNSACTVCGTRRGYIYEDAQSIDVLLTSDGRKNEFDIQGSWERGEATASFPAHLSISDQDRFITQDDPVRYNLLITKGAIGGTDRLHLPSVEEIVRVRDKDAAYVEGTDFTLTTNTSGQPVLDWSLGGAEPAVGTRYVVMLMAHPIWIVEGSPMVRSFARGKSQQLLLRVKVRRYDIAVVEEDG